MKYRRVLGVFLMLAVIISGLTVPVSAKEKITVMLDGKEVYFDVQPQIISGRTMVPVRKMCEAMGAKVAWNNERQFVYIQADDVVLNMTIGNPVITWIDRYNIEPNREILLDVAPYVVEGRTIVPLRAIAEALNMDVKWNDSSNTVVITTIQKSFPEAVISTPIKLFFDSEEIEDGAVTIDQQVHISLDAMLDVIGAKIISRDKKTNAVDSFCLGERIFDCFPFGYAQDYYRIVINEDVEIPGGYYYEAIPLGVNDKWGIYKLINNEMYFDYDTAVRFLGAFNYQINVDLKTQGDDSAVIVSQNE